LRAVGGPGPGESPPPGGQRWRLQAVIELLGVRPGPTVQPVQHPAPCLTSASWSRVILFWNFLANSQSRFLAGRLDLVVFG
jgi:hypothetical protein